MHIRHHLPPVIAILACLIFPATLNAAETPPDYTLEEKLAEMERIARSEGLDQQDWTEADWDRCRPDLRKMVEGTYRPNRAAMLANHHRGECFDLHTSYLTPERYAEMNREVEGELSGVGLELTQECREFPQHKITCAVQIVRPLPNGPAIAEGLQKDDVITKILIDDTLTVVEDLRHAVNNLLGKAGTDVTFEVSRNGTPITFTVTRAKVELVTVQWMLIESNSEDLPPVCYILVSSWAKKTIDEIHDAVMQCSTPFAVVDLGNNPGGLLMIAQEFNYARTFSQSRPLVRVVGPHSGRGPMYRTVGDMVEKVYTIERPTDHCSNYPSGVLCMPFNYGMPGNYLPKPPGTLAGITMAFLQDGGSASASEIVVGACKSWNKDGLRLPIEAECRTFGTETRGKLSVQSVVPLPDDSAFRITVAGFIPGTMDFHESGSPIPPDVYVADTPHEPMDGPDKDAQLKAAVDWLYSVHREYQERVTGHRREWHIELQ